MSMIEPDGIEDKDHPLWNRIPEMVADHYLICMTEKSREGTVLFWKHEGKGYTSDVLLAGLFTAEYALEIAKNSHNETMAVEKSKLLYYFNIYTVAEFNSTPTPLETSSSNLEFEKQFPGMVAYDRRVCPVYTEEDLSRVCTVAQILNECLHKSRVKDKINKHISDVTIQLSEDNIIRRAVILEFTILLKELNL